MGGWKMEVGKMFVYVMFPVGCFYYFNNPQYYKKALEEMDRPYESPLAIKAAAEFEQKIREIELEDQKKQLSKLETGKSLFQ